MYTLGLNNNNQDFAWLNSDFAAVFQQQSGQDITKPLDAVLAKMDAQTKAQHLNCLENVFLAGEVDFRKTARCQVQNYLLIIISGILMASILMKCEFFSHVPPLVRP